MGVSARQSLSFSKRNEFLAPDKSPPTRRLALLSLLALAALPILAASPLRAQDDSAFPLRDDAGEPMRNFRIPSELDPANLPGVIWRGRRDGDVILYEFFDYNCAYCRKAAADIAAIAQSDPNLRVGLVNNAILSAGSVQAAKVQQSVLRLYGPAKAYEFHERLYAARGGANGQTALMVAGAMGLDAAKIEQSADSQTVGDVIRRQTRLAESLGLAMTPSFVIAGVAILGWPGEKSLREIIGNARKCDQPVCDGKK
ncbi:thioredoxin domain-containing protein [Methylocystis parvus]|uniref:Thioredoxin domain-containing protein n=1 Tax=Methylocystis parvus TaxID=134 RepID=A0A6B8M3S8_9HYPH|nr:thioredoxin domain-containing protein [Methylocystis parvus]